VTAVNILGRGMASAGLLIEALGGTKVAKHDTKRIDERYNISRLLGYATQLKLMSTCIFYSLE
jgi:hypothetical protein